MYRTGLKYVILLLSIVVLVVAQDRNLFLNANLPLQPVPPYMGRLKYFSEIFYDTVKNSPRLSNVFDVTISPTEASRYLYQAYQDALTKAGIQNSESLSKAIADSLYVTLPFLSQSDYIYSVADAVSAYLLTQNVFDALNPPLLARSFADAVLYNYPENIITAGNGLTLMKAVSNGIVDFLTSHGVFQQESAPALSFELVKHFFSMTVVSEPKTEVTIVAAPGTVPSVLNVYGVARFASTFLQAVDLSPSLQSIFYVNQTASTVSEAWRNAVYTVCDSIGCYYRFGIANSVAQPILQTYDFMSKRLFTKCVANAYALSLLALGRLQSENPESCAQNVVSTVESFLVKLPTDSTLEVKLGAYFNAFKDIVGFNSDFVNQYPMYMYHIGNELYAASSVKKQRYL